MRLSSILLLLPALAIADVQTPLKEKAAGWFDKAKAYIPSNPAPSVVDAGASVVAAKQVEKININNWKRKLSASPDGPQDWMIMLSSSKNESCWRGCDRVNEVWNQSIPLLSTAPQSPRLGYVDCELEALLCATWAAGLPTVWYLNVPQATKGATAQAPGTPSGPTHLHIVTINGTNVTTQDFVKLHTEKTYLQQEEYTGILHPIDGPLAKFGILQPLGYFMYFFSATPSWLIMIGISFFSRQFMARRAGSRVDAQRAAQGPAQRR